MTIPTWARSRDPLCWLLGASTFGFLVATNNPNPLFVGASVALMGIPAAFGIDDLRRQKRENKSSSGSGTDLPSSSGPDSAVLPSLPSSLSGDES
jgi:hypothetical protein